MDYLSPGQASVAVLGIAKLLHDTHLEIRLAGLCRMLSHRLLLRTMIISLLLANPRLSSQNQTSSCYFGVRATQ